MIVPGRLAKARLDEDLTDVLEEMGRADVNQIPVMENDRFVGMVTRGNILALLRRRGNIAAAPRGT